MPGLLVVCFAQPGYAVEENTDQFGLSAYAGFGKDGAQVRASRVAPNVQDFGGVFKRQTIGQLDGQRGFGRGEVKQLLRQTNGRIDTTFGVSQEDGHTGTLLAFGPLVRRNGLNNQAPCQSA